MFKAPSRGLNALGRPFVYFFKFPFYTNVCMLTLSLCASPTHLMLPYGTEGCPGGEDMGCQPIWELMPHYPITEPLGDGASGYQCPLLMWSVFHLVEKEPQCLQHLFIFGHHYLYALYQRGFGPKFDEKKFRETSLFFLITDGDDFHNKFLPDSRNCPKEALKTPTELTEPSRKFFLYDYWP
jgi:hypothetical protein